MTDQELLQKYVRQKSHDALCELVRRHTDMVHATALRELRDTHLADDVTQAVFLVLMKRAATLSSKVIIGGWLFKTTMYAIAGVRRQRLLEKRHEREIAHMQTPSDVSSDHVDHDAVPLLNAAISALPGADRDAIVLRYFEGHCTEQVAAAMGTSENTARQRLTRALARLRRQFARKGILLAPAAILLLMESQKVQAAPMALAGRLESMILHGANPVESVNVLAHGVLKMMYHAKLLSVTAITAALAITAIGAGVAFSAGGHPATMTAAPPPTTAPTTRGTVVGMTSKYGPAKTPSGTVQAAYAAALEGDAAGVLACADKPTPAHVKTILEFCNFLAAINNLSTAAEARFGKEAAVQLIQAQIFVGVDPSDISRAKETITGDTAVVDIGSSGPGKMTLTKVGEVWKIPDAFVDSWDAEFVAKMATHIPRLKQMTTDIQDKKYAGIKDVMADLQALLQVQFDQPQKN